MPIFSNKLFMASILIFIHTIGFQFIHASNIVLNCQAQILLDGWIDAIKNGDISTVQALIDKINVNYSVRGLPPLCAAAFKGYENIVKLLLAVPGINPRIQNVNGDTPLICASAQGHENIVKLFFRDPLTNINHQNENGDTALTLAAFYGYENIVKLLLQIPNININAQSKVGMNPLIGAAYKNHINIIKLLLQVPGIDINAQNTDGQTALILGAKTGHIDVVNLLLQCPRIKLFTSDKNGKTAGDCNHTAIAELIMNLINKYTQAYEAIRQNCLESLKATIEQTGEVQYLADKEGMTLLDHAFTINNLEIIQYLLSMAKDPQEELARFPFVFTNPTSGLFEYFLDLAYGLQPKTTNLVQDKKSQAICQVCSEPATKLCSRCKKVYYCCLKCQKTDWKIHKTQCTKPG